MFSGHFILLLPLLFSLHSAAGFLFDFDRFMENIGKKTQQIIQNAQKLTEESVKAYNNGPTNGTCDLFIDGPGPVRIVDTRNNVEHQTNLDLNCPSGKMVFHIKRGVAIVGSCT